MFSNKIQRFSPYTNVNARNSDNSESVGIRKYINEFEESNSTQTDVFGGQNSKERDFFNGLLEKQIKNSEDEALDLSSSTGSRDEVKASYNIRALSKHADTYELETFKKKALIIFNHEHIEGFEPRHGTEKDVEALNNTFTGFGFEVTEYKDLSRTEIFFTLSTFFKQDFTDYGCIGIAVLSHGSNFGQLWAKDEKYNEMQIVSFFNVYDKPTLVTKPKFLIVQACRGTKVFPGAPVIRHSTKYAQMRASTIPSFEPYHLPVDADLLILHSSYTGSPSHRDERTGSWFIQSLCIKINQLAATHDLESIITSVKRDVAINRELEKYNMNTLLMQVNKQMPVMSTTLIRKLYLKKFEDLPATLPTSDSDVTNC